MKSKTMYHIEEFEEVGPYRIIPNSIKPDQIIRNPPPQTPMTTKTTKSTKPATCKRTNAPCKIEQRVNAINAYATALNTYIDEVANQQEVINHRSKVGLWIAIVAFVVAIGHSIIALVAH